MKQENEKRSFWKRFFPSGRTEEAPAQEAPPLIVISPNPKPAMRPDGGTVLLIPDDERNIMPIMDGKLRLSVRCNDTVSQVEIRDFPCVVGRSREEAALLLTDTSVSRKHAMLERVEGSCFITDTESSNGVIVNSERLGPGSRRQIVSGDVIKIGRAELQVLDME